MDSLRVGLGRAIRDLRRAHHLSQERLAIAAGIHRSFVFRMERGEVNVSLGTLQRLAQPLGVSISDLLTRAEGFSESAERHAPELA